MVLIVYDTNTKQNICVTHALSAVFRSLKVRIFPKTNWIEVQKFKPNYYFWGKKKKQKNVETPSAGLDSK